MRIFTDFAAMFGFMVGEYFFIPLTIFTVQILTCAFMIVRKIRCKQKGLMKYAIPLAMLVLPYITLEIMLLLGMDANVIGFYNFIGIMIIIMFLYVVSFIMFIVSLYHDRKIKSSIKE